MKNILLICLLFIVACSTVPQTPGQGVYAAKATFAGALGAAVQYASLPRCVEGVPVLQACSDQGVLDDMKKASLAAQEALDEAEKVVRTPGVGDSAITAAVASASAAVEAFVKITQMVDIPGAI